MWPDGGNENVHSNDVTHTFIKWNGERGQEGDRKPTEIYIQEGESDQLIMFLSELRNKCKIFTWFSNKMMIYDFSKEVHVMDQKREWSATNEKLVKWWRLGGQTALLTINQDGG